MSKYKKISGEEINESGQHDPARALLMVHANTVLSDAGAQATGQKKREPSFHESGWQITLHDGSEGNVVGLWSCWLNNEFYLGYPSDVEIPDDLVMKTLGVEYARAVSQVSATAVNDENYKGELKDSDKPLEENEAGQLVAYQSAGPRLWATFFGPEEEKGGRVWVEKSDFNSNSHRMPIITNGGRLVEIYFGHEQSRGVNTFPFNFHSKYSPESPTADPEAIQRYRSGFLDLAVETAMVVGQPSKVTVNYGFVMVPEDLEREGYENVEWLTGGPGIRQGWGKELVRAEKDGEIVMLKSGNSIVPWSTIRQLEVPVSDRNREGLVKIVRNLLTF